MSFNACLEILVSCRCCDVLKKQAEKQTLVHSCITPNGKTFLQVYGLRKTFNFIFL